MDEKEKGRGLKMYRIWDCVKRCYRYDLFVNHTGSVCLSNDGQGCCICHPAKDRWRVELYVGFCDCQGDKIYQGDILIKRTAYDNYIKEVVFVAGGFGVLNYPLIYSREDELRCNVSYFANHNLVHYSSFEILGNIHTHDWLLSLTNRSGIWVGWENGGI